MSESTRAPSTQVLGETASLCPYCLRRLPSVLERVGDEVFLSRDCPRHGSIRTLVWSGPPDYEDWRSSVPPGSSLGPSCPARCGLCDEHLQSTCCVLLEVTQRCDLACPVCFADSRPDRADDPSAEEIERWFAHLADVAPGCNIQLSGGEPTMRDDVPRILAIGHRYGFGFFQLNTNGLRLGREEGYAARLAAAGLTTVFLQFDGVDEAPYRILRGASLLKQKLAAIDACAAAGLGVVLVPTVVPGVNVRQIGALIDFAIEGLPAVRGVHLQPISYFGRVQDSPALASAPRITLPEIVRAVVEQTEGRLPESAFQPAACEHPVCSFHAEFLVAVDGRIVPLGHRGDERHERSGRASAAEKARHTAIRWTARSPSRRCCCSSSAARFAGEAFSGHAPQSRQAAPEDPWDRLLDEVRGRTFSVTGMAFQDAWTLDLERLRSCCLHVLSRDLRRVPFCAFNATAADGTHLSGLWRGRSEDMSGGAKAEATQGSPHE